MLVMCPFKYFANYETLDQFKYSKNSNQEKKKQVTCQNSVVSELIILAKMINIDMNVRLSREQFTHIGVVNY